MFARSVVCAAVLAMLYLEPAAAQVMQVMIKDAKGCKLMNPFVTTEILPDGTKLAVEPFELPKPGG